MVVHVMMGMVACLASTGTQPNNEVQELRNIVNELREEVAELKHDKENDWITEKRAEEIRNIVHAVLVDADTRANLQGGYVTAGWDKGPYLTSTDGNFRLNIGGQLQVRYLYNDADGLVDNRGFEQRRTKIKFSGHVFDPSWEYKIVGTWGRNGGSNTEDAWIAKSFEDGSWLKAGQFKGGFLRESIVSSGKQLGVERSMLDTAFTYGWVQGINYGYMNNDFKLTAQYLDGPGSTNTQALTTGIHAWLVRAEFKFGDAGWGDVGSFTSKVGGKDGFLVGVGYQNLDSDAGTMEYGNAIVDKSTGWTVDATWRGDGWNIFAYGVETEGEVKATGVTQDSSGWLIQGGFMVNDNLELFAQFQEGTIDGNPTFTNGSADMSATRIGFNYWPIAGNNAIKWTTDVAWAGDSLADGAATSGAASADWTSTGNGWRSDSGSNDDQFLLRSQLQLLF